MLPAKILFQRFLFVLSSEVLKVVAVNLAILHLPFRLLRNFSKPSSPTPRPTPRPGVHLTTHQPAPTYTQPRDTVVLIHGFPDNSSLWDSTVARLTTEGYRCITVDLPGANGESVPHILYHTDIVPMIIDALKPVCNTPFTLVGHDWGSIYSLFLTSAQPQLIRRLILLDVGIMSSAVHWTAWLCILSYQSTFALFFLLGEPCDRLHRFLVNTFRYRARPLEQVKTDMSYHYAAFFWTLTKLAVGLEKNPISEPVNASVPQLYVYGRKKIFHFHDSPFIEQVRSSPCGEVVAFPCSHWLMLDLPEEWLKLLTEWLEKSENVIPRAH